MNEGDHMFSPQIYNKLQNIKVLLNNILEVIPVVRRYYLVEVNWI